VLEGYPVFKKVEAVLEGYGVEELGGGGGCEVWLVVEVVGFAPVLYVVKDVSLGGYVFGGW
jgi:hypothetical protein